MPSARAITGDMDERIGKAIKNFRIAQGISQTDLGKPLGLTFQQIQKYESGVNRISTSALIVLCKTLGISPVDVIGPLINETTESAGLVSQLADTKKQLADLKASIRALVK